MVVACTILICNGSLKYFFSQTGTQAIAAKGGVGEILFGWFFNNKVSFQNGSEFAASVLVILSLLYIIQLKNKHEQQQKNYVDIVIAAIFTLGVVGGIILCTKSEMFSRSFDGHNYLSPYSVFMIIVPLFFVFVAKTIYDFALKKQALEKRLCCIALTGAYISIAYGCGMSGGLAEGQATIGVGFIVAILLDNMKFKYSEVGKVAVVMICVLFTIQSAAKKMNYTYNWWGMDESSYWENTRESSDIDILKGIRLSEETLKSYETIYNIISEKTTKEDSIYCFPQIPIFYTICDRMDPGVRAKVEWFDVASDKSIIADMNVIEVNQPKAILIYETSEYAYACHENIFRAGEISATRKMKNFLLNYACKNGYTLYGRIESTDNNSFLLYYKEDGVQDGYTFIGDGTKEDPYLITSAQDLVQLSNQVANGNDFSKMYFRQTQDIDMGLCKEWKPIGEFDSGFYFNGVYDGNGFVIKSLHYDEGANIGLFGQLGGIVCNLGVVDCEFSGNCCGVIASHAVDENAMIINCYTNSKISGLRAGGIADNFVGQIINCVSYGECSGIESAGAVSYENGSISNVYGSIDNISSHIYNSYGNMAVKYCTEEYISGYLCDTLNNEVYKINTCVSSYNEMGEIYSGDIAYESWMSMATWCSWGKNKNGYAVLISK